MSASSVLKSLQDWYQSQTNGIWEHQYGIKIDTLDNPGWSMAIDLSKTKLQSKEFKEMVMERSDRDWYHCCVKNSIFKAACGPGNLEEVLQIFIKWSDS